MNLKLVELPVVSPKNVIEVNPHQNISARDLDRIVQMTWEDRTPFDLVALPFGVNVSPIIKTMRAKINTSSFRMCKTRDLGRKTKHLRK